MRVKTTNGRQYATRLEQPEFCHKNAAVQGIAECSPEQGFELPQNIGDTSYDLPVQT